MSDLRRLQRKLIPVNIIVAIISLVAAISIIFAPLITINVGDIAEDIAGVFTQEESAGDEENSSGSTDYVGMILDTVGDMKLSFTTLNIAKFAFSKNPLDNLTESVAGIIKDVEDDLVGNVAVVMIPKLIESIDDLDVDTDKIDVKKVLNKFDDVLNADGDEQVDQAIEALVDEIQRQAVSKDGEPLIPDDIKGDIQDKIREFYDDTKEALGDEDMTLESFICVTISKMLNGKSESSPDASAVAAYAEAEDGESSESNSGKIYTNYRDLINGMLGISDSTENTDGVLDGLSGMIDMLMLVPKIFAIVMFFFAGIWFIQFLFAFFHMFSKNKRFLMWYTKLWGLTPCLIFGILPLLAGWIIPMIVPEAAAYLGILGAFSTMTWISGGCYLLLWIISIFWAFPIKRKIRKLLKSGATYND